MYRRNTNDTDAYLNAERAALELHKELMGKIELDHSLLNMYATQTTRVAKSQTKVYETLVMSITDLYFS